MTTIYALVDPITNAVRYVGRTGNLPLRYAGHLAHSKRRRTRKDIWIDDLRRRDARPCVIILEECRNAIAHERESFWIVSHASPHLLNRHIMVRLTPRELQREEGPLRTVSCRLLSNRSRGCKNQGCRHRSRLRDHGGLGPSCRLKCCAAECDAAKDGGAFMTPSSKVSAYLDLERQADESDGRPAPDLAIKLDAAWRLLTPDEIRWIRARRDDQRNPFEESARSKKVLALLAKVPVGANRDANRITAEWLVGMSPAERGLFAQMAGCKAPSSETWRQLVEAVKQRRTVEEMESEDPFARARGDR